MNIYAWGIEVLRAAEEAGFAFERFMLGERQGSGFYWVRFSVGEFSFDQEISPQMLEYAVMTPAKLAADLVLRAKLAFEQRMSPT